MRKYVFPFVIALVGLSLQHSALAQDTTAHLDANIIHQPNLVAIKNVSPDMMAWWLDPTHNKEPLPFMASRETAANLLPLSPGEKDGANPLPKYRLPEGVEKIAVVSANQIAIVGTEAGVVAVKEVIETLDKSLRQVEIKVQYVRIDQERVKRLGIFNVAPLKDDPNTTWGTLPTNIASTVHVANSSFGNSRAAESGPSDFASNAILTEFENKKQVQIVVTSRISSIENLTASLSSATSRPIFLGAKQGIPQFGDGETQVLIYTTTSNGMTVRPTINEDESVGLVIAPGLVLQLQVTDPDHGKTSPDDAKRRVDWQRQLGGTLTLPNIKDRQTVAIMGLDSRFFFPPTKSGKQGKQTNMLLLVTPRIIHRSGEVGLDAPVHQAHKIG